MTANAALTKLLTLIADRLMAAQLGIYRAEWDLEVDPAADKMAAVQGMVQHQSTFHMLCASPELGALPARTGDALVDELRRLHAHAKGIPVETMRAATGAAIQCLQAWHAARAANDYKVVLEAHTQVVNLQRQMAQVKAQNLSELYGRDVSPYEALIDNFDPGRTLAFIKSSFSEVADVCRALLSFRGGQSAPFYTGAIAGDKQEAVARSMITAMGYDDKEPQGRLGVSTHPMCRRVGPREVWLSNRYGENNVAENLLNLIHEGGHGRYYQGLPAELANTWMGGVAGETINEGMALFAEQVVGRSKAMATWLAPQIEKSLGIPCSATAFHKDVTAITPDAIRADAREVVYPLHLLLRLDVEEQLINNAMPLADLPAYWNNQSAALIGITPLDDLTGCLQDIHHFIGYIGYFPCYLLGFMAAAQAGAALKRTHPDIENDWARGDFNRTNTWLADNVYKYGRMLSADALVEKATGAAFGPQALIAHLQERYGNG